MMPDYEEGLLDIGTGRPPCPIGLVTRERCKRPKLLTTPLRSRFNSHALSSHASKWDHAARKFGAIAILTASA
jgi:hypothetical protein